MPTPVSAVTCIEMDLAGIATAAGRIVVFVTAEGKLDQAGRRVNRLTKGALERCVGSESFTKLEQGESIEMAWPTGCAAAALQVVKMDRRPKADIARKAGAEIGARAKEEVLVCLGAIGRAADVLLGALSRSYSYQDMRSDDPKPAARFTFMTNAQEALSKEAETVQALVSGVFFTRDLTTAPANVLTTTEFASQLQDLEKLGVTVEVLDEPALKELGMRCLLGVGQGSVSPSKVVVMQWNNGGAADTLALIGKGVVFDTGGISLKPGAGMEDMTMDMGGAGVVSGVMKSLAMRKAKANVVGLVGLVENMPDADAIRPGDVITSMKGDTVEILNTDAEGRLVLADVMWYAQDRFQPAAMVDLATLTGAIIIALGHEKAGVFSNDDAFCNAFLKAADAEGEGAWRLPLAPAYDKLLKSPIADMKNIGGRPAGSVTAAQFLQRFVKDDTPWIHLDIAGVAKTSSETTMAPKGCTGWGVLALNRLVADRFEES